MISDLPLDLLIMNSPDLALAILFLFLSFTNAYHGDMIAYKPSGANFCGSSSQTTDAVIAVSATIMYPPNPSNPLCNSKTTIYNSITGKFVPATIVDVCKDCADGDIAVSTSLFKEVAPGVDMDSTVSGIKWGGALWYKIAKGRGL